MTPPDAPCAAPPLPDGAADSGSQSPAAALINKIRAATSLDDLFLKLKEDLAALFEVEQLTLYAIDRENRELYSRFLLDPLQGIQEIRVPIDATSVSGYCARYGKTLNIGDVYDADELAAVGPHLTFNRSWDERSGFRTRQMLAVPILVDGKYLMGVLLLINKRGGGRFTAEEERFAGTVAEAIGIAIRHHNTATPAANGPASSIICWNKRSSRVPNWKTPWPRRGAATATRNRCCWTPTRFPKQISGGR